MIGMMIQRYFHVGKAAMSVTKTSVLAQLRKSTGYPLSNCKKAMEMYPDDITKAEEWLHAEAKSKGWSKWAKIQTRTATQGLIGICSRDNVGVMVEINCETDFVSRNAEFQQLVEKMVSGCINFAKNLKLEEDITKVVLDESQLGAVQCETATVGELVVAATCKFNEKTIAKRAVCLKVEKDILLNSLSHPAVLCPNLNGASLGKYGVLLAAKEEKTDATEDTEDTEALKVNICQHIIGMNPLSIGELTAKDIAKFSSKISPLEDSESSGGDQSINNTENTKANQSAENFQAEPSAQLENSEDVEDSQNEYQEAMDSGLKETNETQLLFQPYLMAPETTVGETLFKSGVKVLAFERFECGETHVEESPDVAMSASA